jgi:trehalose 6-phosphate synthase/phosphatase
MSPLIVSGRLPIAMRDELPSLRAPARPTIGSGSSGVAAALLGVHDRLDATWIGWPGDLERRAPEHASALAAELSRARMVAVELPAELSRAFDGFAKGVLWPLLHYFVDKVRLDARADWESYRRINEIFAEVVVRHHRRGRPIWIHDEQLALLPALLRARLPDAKIGFFAHAPWPSSEVFRVLPWREAILRGLLGADRIGFQTRAHRFHFAASAAHVIGVDGDEQTLVHDDRRIGLGVHPIGIDVGTVEAIAARADVGSLRADLGGRTLVVGVDRLDYTKGIPRRLLAVERLLERVPERRKDLRYLQLAAPVRERFDAQGEVRRSVNEHVARINGSYGSIDGVPIHYLHRAVSEAERIALYRAADVILVTPLRDGMNLVAKEAIAARVDGDGVLVLSEFAGSADELREAILVNPYDIDDVAHALQRAITMPVEERRRRMAALRGRVRARDLATWADEFLGALSESDRRPRVICAAGSDRRCTADLGPESRSLPAE